MTHPEHARRSEITDDVDAQIDALLWRVVYLERSQRAWAEEVLRIAAERDAVTAELERVQASLQRQVGP